MQLVMGLLDASNESHPSGQVMDEYIEADQARRQTLEKRYGARRYGIGHLILYILSLDVLF